MSWRPLLDGDEAARARSAALEIARDLPPPEGASLSAGAAAQALLHTFVAREGDEAAADRAVAGLEAALEGVTALGSVWILDGVSGVAWTAAHMADVVEVEEDTFAAIDGLIARALAAETWPHEWEYVRGLVGLGVYGLERGAAGEPIVARAVSHLAARAERRDGGTITWISPTTLLPESHREANRHGYLNLGLAHGVPGVLMFLAECHARGIAGAEELLRGGIAWLRSEDRGDPAARFPLMIARDLELSGQRDGWCYGDQAIAAVFLRAGQVLGEPPLIDLALDIARAVARREPNTPLDAAFCHGTLGRAHMFNRLAQASGDQELGEAARFWYRTTLDRRAGGEFFCADGQAPALLEGSIGIALGLLAATSTIEPLWDRALLVALPPRPDQ